MKVKHKLRLGFGFLFLVVLFFGVVSLFYINDISNSAKVILKDNYETLTYIRQMQTVLDDHALPLNTAAVQAFNEQLIKEEHNITERGEREAVKALRHSFQALRDPLLTLPQQVAAARSCRLYLRQVEELNMRAIVQKNEKARTSVNQAALVLGFAGAFTFLILFTFSVNFPGFVSGPLNTLLEGIREIGKKNYKKRIHFDQQDEFGEVAAAFNEMAARLDEWENSNLSKILSEKVRIETIIEQMNDAIIGINEQQKVLFMNTAAKLLLNLGEQQTEGVAAPDIAGRNDLFKSVMNEAQAGKPFKIVSGGKDAYYQLEAREIEVPDTAPKERDAPLYIAKKTAGRVYILRNITEFKERDVAKTNFIATISHELKTPISAIKMSLKLLADKRVGDLNAEQGQLVQHIDEDAERLLKITYELLDLSQVETGNIQLNFVPARPEKIVDYALKAVRAEIEQKEITIEELTSTGLPDIQADVEKTAWVMINFLSNALRYSPTKSKVQVQVAIKDKMVEFSVRDFGKGIEPQYQERLFDRYFQVPTDGQNKSGTGLGLAISKEFIEAQGGGIGLESELGAGSRFFFKLPVLKKA
ncbi:MAG TPA: ATP-binding protein [Mucilaginibacter sp.]|nr:ATP-binding protein [Mucilaginibacter sp.]